MILEIDFNSDEAIYVQLRNQIIMGIACEEFTDGESLPSVPVSYTHLTLPTIA